MVEAAFRAKQRVFAAVATIAGALPLGRARNAAPIRLPALIPCLRFKPGYVVFWAPYIAAYQLVNRFPIREPVELQLTALDQAVPFLPALLPLYISYLLYYFWTVARLTSDRDVNRVFYAVHLQLAISLVFFVLYPVRMPRDLFYTGAAFNWADAFWRWFDAPNNCFPSLHASNVMLLMHVNWQRRGRWAALLVGAAIVASTLFVKQHYAVDLVAGFVVYLVAVAFLNRLEITGADESGRRVDPVRA